MECKHSDSNSDSLEYLFSSMPVTDLYTTDDQQEQNIKRLKRQGQKKFLTHNTISSDESQSIETKYFMGFQFSSVKAEVDVDTAAVDEIVAEAFKFIFPGGVPEYFYKYYDKGKATKWSHIASEMSSDFLAVKHHAWLKDKYSFDYTNAAWKDFYKEKEQLDEAYQSILSDPKNIHHYDVIKMKNSVDLANEMLIMFNYLALAAECVDINKKHDIVKNVFCKIATFLNLNCKVNGATKYEYYYPGIPERKIGMLQIKANPDAALFVSVPGTCYPYCVVEVYCPDSENVYAAQSTFERSSSQYTTENDEVNDCSRMQNQTSINDNKAMKKIKLKYDVECQDIMTKVTSDVKCKLYTDNSIATKIKEEIIAVSPISHNLGTAFQKSTAQLPIDMYGLLVQQELVRKSVDNLLYFNNPLKSRKYYEGVGLFVMNEYVYLEKVKEKDEDLQRSLHKIVLAGEKDSPQPQVMLADWCFDLKKPNQRLAFLIVLFYHEKIVCCDMMACHWNRNK